MVRQQILERGKRKVAALEERTCVAQIAKRPVRQKNEGRERDQGVGCIRVNPGQAARNIRSMRFWQRTSSSSLMSCCVAELIFLVARKFWRMMPPAARAASMAD